MISNAQVVQKFDGPYLRVESYSTPLLNMVNFDFLGLGQREELKVAAVQALDKVRGGVLDDGRVVLVGVLFV